MSNRKGSFRRLLRNLRRSRDSQEHPENALNIDAALEQLSDHDRLQIEQASNGCCSGTLAEWPDLRASLDKLRIVLPGDTGSSTVMLVCWLIQTRKDSQ